MMIYTRVLSLGAGVQSTTLLMMILAGEIEPVAAAIFADTGGEPNAVYKHLEWCDEQIGDAFPLVRTSFGDLAEQVLQSQRGERTRLDQPPFYVKAAMQTMDTADTGGMIWRQCTRAFKIDPVRRECKRIYEENGRQIIQQVIGISFDERSRCKESGVKYIANEYPLVDRRITRQDCLNWMKSHNYPEPAKSACYFCPYTSNRRWRDMKKNDPETFMRAVEFDNALRDGGRSLPGVTHGLAYVHRSFIPLQDVTFKDEHQLDFEFGFENECEGMCGV